MIENNQNKEPGKGRRKNTDEGRGERREEARRGRGGPAASSAPKAEEQPSSFGGVLGTPPGPSPSLPASSHCALLLKRTENAEAWGELRQPDVVSGHVSSCHVSSCHVPSCHVPFYHMSSCHVSSCHVSRNHIVVNDGPCF